MKHLYSFGKKDVFILRVLPKHKTQPPPASGYAFRHRLTHKLEELGSAMSIMAKNKIAQTAQRDQNFPLDLMAILLPRHLFLIKKLDPF